MNQKSNRGGLRNPPGGRPSKPDKKQTISLRLHPDLIEKLRQEKNFTKLIENLLTNYFHEKDHQHDANNLRPLSNHLGK